MMYNASVACYNILNGPKETDGQITTCTYYDDGRFGRDLCDSASAFEKGYRGLLYAI